MDNFIHQVALNVRIQWYADIPQCADMPHSPQLVTKDFPHELLIGSDAISRGNGKIEYGTRKVTSFGQNFSITPYTDFILDTASV